MMLKTHPGSQDTWIISSYFNPENFATKRENLSAFITGLGSHASRLLLIEMVGRGKESSLHNIGCQVLVAGSGSLLWQKERLLNIGLTALPGRATNVVWADCDLLFENEDWIDDTARLLVDYPLVQPFSSAVRLSRGNILPVDGDLRYASFGRRYLDTGGRITPNFVRHGHTGFAWAGRRDWLNNVRFYETCLSGSGDHVMAHAFCGDFHSDCIIRTFGRGSIYHEHFNRWAIRAQKAVCGKVGACDGEVRHLWHGDYENRCYYERDRELLDLDFNPERDLIADRDAPLELSGLNPELAEWSKRYFSSRKEDG